MKSLMKKIIVFLCVALLAVSTMSFVACNKDDNQFVVATNCPFEPFEYIKDGKVYGIDMEIAAGYAEKHDLKLVIKHMDFDAILSNVSSGYADIGMAGMTISEDRLETNDFTDTYYNASQKLIVKADNTAFDSCVTAGDVETIISGLSNKKLGYQIGTTGNWYVAGDADWGYDGFANIIATGYDSAQTAVMDLINGNIYGVVVDNAPATAIVAAMNATETKVKIIDIALTEEEYAFGVKKGNTKLIESFNAYLDEIKDNGKFQEIIDKYFGNSDVAKIGYSIKLS